MSDDGYTGFKIIIPGPFTLTVEFTLTKDGREDVGNLAKPSKWSRKFDTLEEALAFLDSIASLTNV